MDIRDIIVTYELKRYAAQKAAEQRMLEERYNKYHDPKNGRFTSGNGTGSSAGVDKRDKEVYNDNSYDFHPVSKDALSAKLQCDCFDDDELNAVISNEMHNILEEAASHIPGTEIGKTITMAGQHVSPSVVGEEGTGFIDIPEIKEPYISIHNHASGETLSTDDLSILIRHMDEQGAFVIGNNENIYGIIKTTGYNWIGLQNKCVNISYDDVIKDLKEGRGDYGLQYYERVLG